MPPDNIFGVQRLAVFGFEGKLAEGDRLELPASLLGLRRLDQRRGAVADGTLDERPVGRAAGVILLISRQECSVQILLEVLLRGVRDLAG